MAHRLGPQTPAQTTAILSSQMAEGIYSILKYWELSMIRKHPEISASNCHLPQWLLLPGALFYHSALFHHRSCSANSGATSSSPSSCVAAELLLSVQT